MTDQNRTELITNYYRQAKLANAESFMDRGKWYQSQGMNEQAIEDYS